MKKIYALAYIFLLAGTLAINAYAQTIKITPLPEIEEQRLIALAKKRKTADGVSVEEVLNYAQKIKKQKFKLASIEVHYTIDSKPDNVAICYWIGSRRSEEDQFCNLGYNISPDLKKLTPKEDDTKLLDRGRVAFITYIDERYSSVE